MRNRLKLDENAMHACLRNIRVCCALCGRVWRQWSCEGICPTCDQCDQLCDRLLPVWPNLNMIQLHIPPRVLTSQTLHTENVMTSVMFDLDWSWPCWAEKKHARQSEGDFTSLHFDTLFHSLFTIIFHWSCDPPPLQGVKFEFFNTYLMFLYPYSMKPCVQSKDIEKAIQL